MNLLITGAWAEAEAYIPKIGAMGHMTVFMQQEKDELPCDPEWVEGVIGNGLFLHHPIETFVNLRFIQLTSAGYDRLPMDYITERNIEIHNAAGVYSIPMAEFAAAGVLWLFKKARFFEEGKRQKRWQKCREVRELSGSTVVIAGCGSVGTECAKRFAVFGCHVVGVDVVTAEKEPFEAILPPDKLDEAIKAADVFLIALPLTAQTRGLIDERRLGLMKPESVLVNISRGAVVDEKALERCLGRMGGVILDVFEEEPLSPQSSLWEMENVIITPHNSFVGEGNAKRLADVIMQHISRLA